jgi:hypothetical protein
MALSSTAAPCSCGSDRLAHGRFLIPFAVIALKAGSRRYSQPLRRSVVSSLARAVFRRCAVAAWWLVPMQLHSGDATTSGNAIPPPVRRSSAPSTRRRAAAEAKAE